MALIDGEGHSHSPHSYFSLENKWPCPSATFPQPQQMQKKKPSNLCKKRDFKGSIKMMNLFYVGVYSNSFFNFFKLIIFNFLNSPIAARGREVLKSAKYNIISKIP
jgi:hypothetical protein